ncbi:MAG: ATP synthase F1 subunit gamma [Thermoanaerobaculales bacterium]|nr:ATP synthase F1 subunit gamma [Thermoanaerobaculales bacterium]
MPSTRDLTRRIRSVKGTQQITKAMKMVAAAKLRRAQEAVENARPYADTLSKVLANVAARTEESHPLLERRESGRVWLVVVSSDKGLCGSFNANMLRQVEKDLKAGRWADVELVNIGRKASDYFRVRDFAVAHEERDTMNTLGPAVGPRLGGMFMKAFTSGQVDEVWVVYNKFVSVLRQEITFEQLLPIEPPTADPDAADEGTDYLYEPGAGGLLATLLPAYVETQVQRILYDSAAAEQASRMTSMGAATKNAGEMIDALTMLYNRTRQAAITKELIEIVSGAQALGD